MAKVMLVEDDNNLREIYEARLLAEGYEIVSARDGEEALALAVKERPDLIIADVMMPKISGFDMLDILRSTPETKDTKVIMMTALSQAEDKARAAQLGADRYLVKSQVTLEDVAKVAKEVLGGEPASGPTADTGLTQPTAPVDPAPVAAAPAPEPTVTPVATPPADSPAANDPAALAEPAKQEEAEVKAQLDDFATNAPAVVVTPDPTPAPAPAKTDTKPATEEPSAIKTIHSKVIQPINDTRVDGNANLQDLLAKEKVKEDIAKVADPIIGRPSPEAAAAAPPPAVPADDAKGPADDPNNIAL